MLKYFIFNSIDSRDFGIQVGAFPEKVIPKKRLTSVTIQGRNGTLTETDNCYDSYPYSIECFCSKTENFSKIGAWLNGNGTLIKSDELDKIYFVKIKNSITLEDVAEYWKNFVIPLEIEPINYSVKEYTLDVTNATSVFNVGGTMPTEPILELDVLGDVQITLNNKNIILTGANGRILIDTNLMIITQNGLNATHILGGNNLDEIRLIPEDNTIDIISFDNISNFTIRYREANLC